MNIRIVGKSIDERFLQHRMRSTSYAGIAVAVGALCIFAYRFYVRHVWNWDLLGVGIAFVVIKLALMAWYHFTD